MNKIIVNTNISYASVASGENKHGKNLITSLVFILNILMMKRDLNN